MVWCCLCLALHKVRKQYSKNESLISDLGVHYNIRSSRVPTSGQGDVDNMCFVARSLLRTEGVTLSRAWVGGAHTQTPRLRNKKPAQAPREKTTLVVVLLKLQQQNDTHPAVSMSYHWAYGGAVNKQHGIEFMNSKTIRISCLGLRIGQCEVWFNARLI